MLNIIFETRGN